MHELRHIYKTMSLSLRNNSRLAAAGLNKNNQIDPNLGVLREGFQSQELFDENNARAKQEDHHMGVRDEFPNDKEDAGAKQEDPHLGVRDEFQDEFQNDKEDAGARQEDHNLGVHDGAQFHELFEVCVCGCVHTCLDSVFLGTHRHPRRSFAFCFAFCFVLFFVLFCFVF